MDMHSSFRALVVHTGHRDNYEVAKSFSEIGIETHLVTDFYYVPDHYAARFAHMIFGALVWKRHRSDLTLKIHTSIPLLMTDLLERVLPRNATVNKLRSYFLGRCARSIIRRQNITHAVFYYNSGAHLVPEKMRRTCRVILFQMHPHPSLIRKAYDFYLQRRPQLISDLYSQEEELTHDQRYLSRLTSEAEESDVVICTSSFTRHSLLNIGISAAKIHTAAYGFTSFETNCENLVTESVDEEQKAQSQIKLAFVGQFAVRKGVYELIALLKDRLDIYLTIYTREPRFALSCIDRWFGALPRNIEIKSILSDAALWVDVKENDFLVLASIVEGFGLVISEAMAHGLPVIGSANTSAADLVVDGISGFITSGFFKEDLEVACDRAIEAKGEWMSMRTEAARVASSHSWEKFRAELRQIILEAK